MATIVYTGEKAGFRSFTGIMSARAGEGLIDISVYSARETRIYVIMDALAAERHISR